MRAMKIIRSEVLGFCAGVRLAVDKAEKALAETKNTAENPVYTFGPLIHNKIALDALEKKGLSILTEENIENAKSGTVIIRAHGVAPEIEEKLKESGFSIINATCPRVIVSQKKSADFAKKGYSVILAGDKNHGEVIGIKGWAEKAIREGGEGKFFLVENCSDVEKLVNDGFSGKTVFLSQTTFSPSEFDKMAEILKSKISDLEVIKSICPATRERQTSLEKLCSQVDGIIVIGGKNSANSMRLFVTAEKLCKNACFIEKADEIPEIFFTFETVGITAGASTPDFIIEEVEQKLLDN